MPTITFWRPGQAAAPSRFEETARYFERPSNLGLIILGVAAGAAVVVLMGNPTGVLALAMAAVMVSVALWKAVALTIRDRTWLVFPLLLTELLISTELLPDQIRPLVHYGMLALFCIPMLPVAWRATTLRQGGFRLYTVYFAIAAVSLLYSIAPGTSFVRLGSALLGFVAICGLASLVEDDDDLRRILWHALLACSIAVAINAIAAVVLPGSITWQVGDPDSVDAGVARFVGILAGPNQIGEMMLVSVGIALAYYHYVDRRVELAVVAGTIICALGLAGLADSRSPFVALAIGIAAWTVRKYKLKGLLAVGACGAAIAAGLMLVGKDLSAQISGRSITTMTGRTNLWPFVFHKISQHPIFGYGYDVAGQIFDSRYFPLWWGPWDEGPRSSLHSGYLDRAISVGVPAALLWLYVVIRPWWRVMREGNDRATPLFGILFFVVVPLLIINFDESAIGDFRGAGGVAFGLVWALIETRRIEEDLAQQQDPLSARVMFRRLN